jgi:hypothetical protein
MAISLRKTLDELAENPVFLRYARWGYCRGASGIPPGPLRLVLGVAARFAAFTLVFFGCQAVVAARGGDWRAGAFFVGLFAWLLSSVAARLARGYPVFIGTEPEPMVRLRTERRNGTLEPLMLTRLSSAEAFAGYAWPDYLIFATIILENAPLAFFIPSRFWARDLGIPLEALWFVIPLAAADLALYLLTLNLAYWIRSLSPRGRFGAWRAFHHLGGVALWCLYAGLVGTVWIALGRGWAGLLALGAIEALSAWARLSYVKRVWRRLSEEFWPLVRQRLIDP